MLSTVLFATIFAGMRPSGNSCGKETMKKTKIQVVLISALAGVMLSTVLILFDNALSGDDYGLWIILTIPAALVTSAFGANNPIVHNAYIVNGILFAITFAAIAAFWQFIMKGDNENK
jgi:hypothetical protein